MSIDRIWTKRQHSSSEELIRKFGSSLSELIEHGNGTFTGSYREILMNARLEHDIYKEGNYYGDLFNDMNKVKEAYGIDSKPAGPKGATYWFKEIIKEDVKVGAYTNEINSIIKNLDLEKATGEECKDILVMLKRFIEIQENKQS